MKYEKRAAEVDAIIWDGTNKEEITAFCEGSALFRRNGSLNVVSMEGTRIANRGDYIVKDDKGGFRPCNPILFKRSYGGKKP